jgi:hypothetical protein
MEDYRALEAEKNIYRETEENMKKELAGKRDDW